MEYIGTVGPVLISIRRLHLQPSAHVPIDRRRVRPLLFHLFLSKSDLTTLEIDPVPFQLAKRPKPHADVIPDDKQGAQVLRQFIQKCPIWSSAMNPSRALSSSKRRIHGLQFTSGGSVRIPSENARRTIAGSRLIVASETPAERRDRM